ncbi:hypothetical protein [Selenomonas sp. oral taxon 138]|uniref:hypothetical protein n=1 Tax=Selenomonas sp. oral taxon 138 TaxID=712532 RepID=UPI0002A20AE8|nr:hypothetical protein [Selenomonas sp. oral taxon 138]EKY01830.1 hypothetical protein HMPREF9163_00012 [Selenomonas sp. oral taxon 138 str. F0429]
MAGSTKANMTYEEYLIRLKEGHRNRSWEMSCDAAAAHAQGRWKAQILYEMCMHDESVVVN